ncbi:MAG: prepilin peptidase [Candidatus Zixiibacteriota bacterium]|nr:MAG: prepilin peptidase [candidate division Zixibacteria bacterium]
MGTPIYILTGVLGLAIGSFLNAAIYRIPRQKKLSRGRSVCPHCDYQLRWFHNIPLLSYLFLRGKCANCHRKISPRYPLVEAVNALAYLFFLNRLGLTVTFAVFALLSSALIVVFFIDLDFQIIPDVITLPGMVIGLGVSFLPGGIGFVPALTGLLVGGGSLYLIAVLGDWLFKKESMGGGDIKMAAMLGAFLGWQKILFVFIASAVIGLVVSLVLMAFSRRLREQRVVPFGPFLATAALLAITWGDRLISLYIEHFVARH